MAALPQRLLLHARLAAATPSLRLMVFCAVALWAAWTPLGQAGALNDFRDSHLLHSYEQAAALSVTQYGQVPMWSPWSCGGMYALGNLQSRFASPTLLLSALFGPRRAEPLTVFLFLVLGMEGLFRYARLRSRSALAGLVCAPLFALNGFYAVAWQLGWLNFYGYQLLPWLLLGTAGVCKGRLSGVALVAGAFALMLGYGGTYPVPMCALFVVLEVVGNALAWRTRAQWRQGVWLLGATALLTLGVCAFRLWPVLETFQSAPRIMAGRPGHALPQLGGMLFPLEALQGRAPATFFLCPVVFVLAAVALLTRRVVLPLVGAVLTLWLATGYHYPGALFVRMRELPFYEAMRYPERFLVLFACFASVLGAVGLGVLLARARRSRPVAWVAVGLCALGVAGWVPQRHNFDAITRRVELLPMPEQVEQPFAQARGNRWAQGHFLALNRGSIGCGEAYPVPMSERLRGDLPQEEYLEDPSAGQARRLEWSPHRLEVEVRAERPVHLLVNQNWHPGWKSSVGEVVSREGLLAVSLPEGEHRVVLRFLPRSGLGGALVSLLAWGALGLVAWRARQRRALSGWQVCVIAAVPLAVWALLFVAWREPPAPPDLRNPNGAPIFVQQMPPEAVPVRVAFDVPVELHAARVVERPEENGTLPIELFWRVEGSVPRSVGIFVHLVGPEGQLSNRDHEVISGTFFFKTAPRGVLLRDAFAANVQGWPPGTWRVRVGLWQAGGDGSRVAARDSQGTPLPDSSVVVGTFTVPGREEARGP